MKYSPAGGTITVEVHRSAPYGQPVNNDAATGLSACHGVVISVADEGIGIEAHDLPHVLERFRRGGNAPETVLGSGIGLSSVQQIVHLRGSLDISSRPGAGTRVAVWSPIRTADGQETET
jgi:signal transduction histidine kinase